MALRASELLQNDANVLYLAANALLDQGEINEALGKLQVAAKSNPKHAPTWISLGVAEKRLGHVESAAGHFQHALELDQQSLMALNNLAAIHIEQQRWQKAEELLKQAIAVDARYAKAHRNLAAVYAKQAKLSLAIESLSTAVNLAPEDYQSHLSLGQMLQSQHRTKEAVVHFRRAIQLNSKLVQEANTLAWILATSNDDTIRDGNEALKLAIRCAKQTQYKNPAVFNTLAAAYAEAGDFDNAINWQKKALAAAPAALKQACQTRLELYQQERPFRSSQ